jgi:hypothetical protein
LWAFTAVVLIAAIAGAATVSTAGSDRGAPCRSALIPAYLPASELARIADRPVQGRIVVLNPGNGPGTAPQAAYRAAVRAVQRSGTRVLGYVHTSYGARPQAAVQADVDRYRAWYGVDGIFFDEAASTGAELAYYRTLGRDVRAAGMRLVALNPGVVPARGYFGVADIVVTYEGPYERYAAAIGRTPDWVRRLPAGRVAHLVHGASAEQARAVVDADGGAGYVYATSGTLPDPWSTLPAYLDEQEARLATCP